MSFFKLSLLAILMAMIWSDIALAQRWRCHMNRRKSPIVTVPVGDDLTSANGLIPIPSSVVARTKELQRLYDERVEVAREQYKLGVAIYRNSVGSEFAIDEHLAKSLSQLLTAEYEAATTPRARIDALNRNLANAQLFHDLAKQKFSRGFENGVNLSKAQYLLITARIGLAEEERKLAPRP